MEEMMNEQIDLHFMDGIQIMRALNLENMNREEKPEIEDVIINEHQEVKTMISELSIEAREIIANLLEKNFKLEEELEKSKINLNIAFKWFNRYVDNMKCL